jgi:hypothetical protein
MIRGWEIWRKKGNKKVSGNSVLTITKPAYFWEHSVNRDKDCESGQASLHGDRHHQKDKTRVNFSSLMQMLTAALAVRQEGIARFMAGPNVSKTYRPHYCVEAVLFAR